ncbi:hypothetical protein AA101099_1400 [Neoasaia chiangmaiensis NBRC 101099]|uniref:Uncharacterized protein n=1 Tax=Neoasaia chiangmaiensis TaxID=320497 RepID=A0A1U9KQL0_9PROT|nr:hypothetical protein [Neoasaia chiangmaiensis]AQS88012.1 hypothetical protein A0U93_08725 [Neoasaia chiangmaiensis]GBR38847.1 hypothetical protein AA101099_1400 [Neoasaia chiangmaiensis NBRC 101099]GEN15682.1 hypothetical protein NCH01_21130 [Neoasaia chiangmaiensis]
MTRMTVFANREHATRLFVAGVTLGVLVMSGGCHSGAPSREQPSVGPGGINGGTGPGSTAEPGYATPPIHTPQHGEN